MQLIWKAVSPIAEARSQVFVEPKSFTRPWSKRPRRKTPSKRRRNQRRLQEFLRRKELLKSQARHGASVEDSGFPDREHSSPTEIRSSENVDQTTCHSVVFAMVKDVPGVRYTIHEGDDENWIPVTRKRRGRKRSAPHDIHLEILCISGVYSCLCT